MNGGFQSDIQYSKLIKNIRVVLKISEILLELSIYGKCVDLIQAVNPYIASIICEKYYPMH